jgi:hypothetical protein
MTIVITDKGGVMSKLTNFHPDKNGFNFGNGFKNDFIPAFDIHTSGLCGGMSYAALDYFFSDVPCRFNLSRP